MFTNSVVLLLFSVKTHRLSTKRGISPSRDLSSTDTEGGRACLGAPWAPLRCSKCERKHRTLQGIQRNPCTCGPQETAGGREAQAPLAEKPTNKRTRSNRSRNRPPSHAGLPAAGRVCRCGRAHTRPSTSPSACRADGCSLPPLWAVPAHVFTNV